MQLSVFCILMRNEMQSNVVGQMMHVPSDAEEGVMIESICAIPVQDLVSLFC